MQIYLLATNLFAIAALLLELGNLSGQPRSRRLLPLFLLAISRSLILIITLPAFGRGQVVAISAVNALDVFSTFCVIWILTGPFSDLPPLWKKFARLGAGMALLLSVLPLLPAWPVPSQIHSLMIAVFGPLILLASLGQVRWIYLAPPLILAIANFLNLFDLTSLSWLFSLLAYALVINAVHQGSVSGSNRVYQDRQKAAEALAQEAISFSQEQQRLLDASRELSAVSDLNQSIEHIAESMARVLHVDQSAIVMMDHNAADRACLATFYNSEQPFLVTTRDEVRFALDDYPLLQEAIEGRQQLLLPQQNMNGLDSLYSLWYEDRAGPTLIQPLTLKGKSIGALVLGNPVSRRPIYENDARLCQSLAGQIATMVEYRRRYLALESETEAIVMNVQQQSARPTSPSIQEQAEAVTAILNQTVEHKAHQAIFEAIGDGVVVTDKMGSVKWVNKAAEHILGKPKRALIGQPIGTIYGEIDSGEPIEDLVIAFSRRNHPLPTFIETDERAIQGRLLPWRNEDYEWMGIIAVFRDVTREVKADRARNDFIAALSRELRSPLTAVKGYSELITNGMMNDYSAEQLRVQQIINSSAERMVEVLDNAIQITAENRHKVLPRFEEVDVTRVIDTVLREVTPLVRLRELELSREIKTDLPPVAADAGHLHRILNNLLSNACRFTPPGGRVTLRAWVQAEQEAGVTRPQLILAVADNGVGIPQSELKRIFDPFYQVKDQDNTEDRGMGMGLAVVKELVELHSGRVWVESTAGEGSVFQVALPVTQEY